MEDKWNELKEFINDMEDSFYEEAVWVTCRNILDKMNELESEEEYND